MSTAPFVVVGGSRELAPAVLIFAKFLLSQYDAVDSADQALVLELVRLLTPLVANQAEVRVVYVHSDVEEPGRRERARYYEIARKVLLEVPGLDSSLRVFVLHPTYWLRASLYLNVASLSKEIWRRVEYVDILEDLEKSLGGVPLIASGDIPSYVLEADRIMRAWVGRPECRPKRLDPSKPLMDLSVVDTSTSPAPRQEEPVSESV